MQQHRHYIFVCAFAGKPAERFIAELFRDDRLASRLEHFQTVVSDSVVAVSCIRQYVFERLVVIIGPDVGAPLLASQVARGANICAAYIDRNTFSECRQLPWSLCRGDPNKNLDDLVAGPEPEHPAAQRIRRLAQRGHDRKELLQLIALLTLIRWSTLLVEQAHGSVAVMHRFHHGYVAATLLLRGFSHMFFKLIRSIPVDLKVRRAESKITELQEKVPQRLSGFNTYAKSLSPALPSLLPTLQAQQRTRQLFKLASRLWKAMSVDDRARLRKRNMNSWVRFPSLGDHERALHF